MDLTCMNLLFPKIACLLEFIWLGQAVVGIRRDVNSGNQTAELQRKLTARSTQGQIQKYNKLKQYFYLLRNAFKLCLKIRCLVKSTVQTNPVEVFDYNTRHYK